MSYIIDDINKWIENIKPISGECVSIDITIKDRNKKQLDVVVSIGDSISDERGNYFNSWYKCYVINDKIYPSESCDLNKVKDKFNL